MSWIDALRVPAPAELLGGADHLAGGSTSYFRVNLEPGRYAFVSEGFATQGMVHESPRGEGATRRDSLTLEPRLRQAPESTAERECEKKTDS